MTQKKYESKRLNQSPMSALGQSAINIHGAPTAGKTWLSLTASKDWPEDVLSRNKENPWLELEDVLHVAWDRAALAGLIPYRIKPAYSLEPQAWLHTESMPKVLRAVTEEIQKIIKHDSRIKYVIHDTVSAFDRHSLAYWNHPDNIPKTKKGIPSTQWMYGAHLRYHLWYQTETIKMPLGVTPIYLFHEKIVEDQEGDNETLKRAKTRIKKLGNTSAVMVMPDIIGNGINYYTNDASIEFAIVASKMKGKPTTRKLVTGVHGFERTKNRWEHLFTTEEKPNLQVVFEKIRDAGV